ncbi:C39 family peptidase [Neobacillus dielmonensis]|uniref:C39 family peptidase n=1 Tax=Neobacillus dielmonensis TaxID=1347369 RepID=UPI0005A998BC|nr:C39 family peptidase [Neobacillus dielmonensis]
MKKLWLIASIFPMFGCSHFDEETNTKTSIAPAQTVEETNQPVEEKYNLNDLQRQIIQVQPSETESKSVLLTAKESAMLDVALIKQNPELRYGCEVTSLAMMLQYAGVNTNKLELYRIIKKDPDPLVRSKGDIIRWGNPQDGFVGDMTGKTAGYAAFEKPMLDLINQKLPGRAVNLTNQPFEQLLRHVSNGYPVVVWTTGDYRLPDRLEGWYHGKEYIKTPLDLHVVVLVGYDANYVYVNDPLSGRKQVKVSKNQFISTWKAMQSRAVSYN